MNTHKTRDEKAWPSEEIRTPESGAQPVELNDYWVDGKFVKAKNEDEARCLAQALRRQNCCDVWPELAKGFVWHYDSTDLDGPMVMPCIDAGGGNLHRVDYCPSCGKPARDREMVR